MKSIKKTFDCLAMKRKIQAKIYADTKGMSFEELNQYYEQGAAKFDEKIRQLKEKEKISIQKSVSRIKV